jgi:mannitol-1-/sugar-/sorbitol-6-/2-deoxyglucose-6-phosphatase
VAGQPVLAVILDMDGLLIDTEPVWRAAEASVFASLGIELSESDLLDSTGQAIAELIPIWRRRQPRHPARPQEGTEPSDDELADRITNQVIAHVAAEGAPMPGVTDAIALFIRHGLRLAIASSSPRRLIDAVCQRLGLTEIEVRCSALDEVSGKPAPDVYLAAARALGVTPARCLAIEDSAHGVAAAKSAGMRCIAVPDPLLAADPGYREADAVLPSLRSLDETALRLLGLLPESPSVEAAPPSG